MMALMSKLFWLCAIIEAACCQQVRHMCNVYGPMC